jgi:hypothetical protein
MFVLVLFCVFLLEYEYGAAVCEERDGGRGAVSEDEGSFNRVFEAREGSRVFHDKYFGKLWFREKFQENERKYFGAILLNQVPGLL